jgi:hypothetical protein
MSLLDTASLIVTPNGYKEGKLYSVIPSDGSGDLSVTRATTATRVNSAGLVELVPYNLLSYSEDFSNSIWNKTALSISTNSTTAPNGSTTADTITNSSSSGIILQTYSSVNTSQIVTHSVYLKRTNNDWAVLAIARSGATTYGEMYVWFNLSTGVVGGNLPDGAAVILDTEIENVGNGWYRCSVTGYVPNAVAYTAFMLYPDGNNSFTRVTGQSVYAWGAQLVEGSTAKDYQKTETRLNIPRLDYSNGTCPSLLVEPQRTNLQTYSEALTPNFTFNQCSITSNQIGPNGLNSAKRITNGATANDVYFEQSVGIAVNTYTWSAYVKQGTDASATIKPVHVGIGGDVSFMDFNFASETIITSGAITSSGFTALANGWYRIYCSVPITLAVISLRGRFGNSNTPNVYNEWFGVQLEQGSYPTSYIPTTSASVTRNADVISKTGISSLIGQTEGTLFLDFIAPNGTAPILINLATSNQTYLEAIYLEYDPINSGLSSRIWTNGSLVGGVTANGIIKGNRYKVALAYKANDTSMYIDGSAITGMIQPNAIQANLSQLYLGNLAGLTGSETFTGLIGNAAALWKTRLTNAQLATLTTI